MKYLKIFGAIVLSIKIFNLQGMTSYNPQELLQKMSLSQKAAQLLAAAAVANDAHNKTFMENQPYKMDTAYIKQAITQHEIGAVLFLGRSTVQEQTQITKEFQNLSIKNPLLVMLDAEWGPHMRNEDGFKFPRNMVLGALENNELIKEKGFIVGTQLREMGVHMSLGPVVDVNNNPANRVIHDRSFGSNPTIVAQKGIADMQGLHEAGVDACLKHFPGHGDTATDSHYGLPVMDHNRARLDAIELLPFVEGIKAGARAIMSAQILLTALDSKYPASLSKTIITDLLRNELGFDGLIMTDGMGMQGITDHFEAGEAAVRALEAGIDIILCANVVKNPHDRTHEDPIGTTITAIVNAVKSGRLSEHDIDQKVLRVLYAKKRAFENQSRTTVSSHNADQLKKMIYQQALTITKDATNKAPHRIIHIHGMNKFKENRFGISNEIFNSLKIAKANNESVTVVLYGSPYAVELVQDYADRVIVAYEDDPIAQVVVEEFLAGKCNAPGKLPVEIAQPLLAPTETLKKISDSTYRFTQLK